MRKSYLILLGSIFILSTTLAQAPKKHSSSESYQLLEKLNFLGSALYIAAHPDDENTRLISYLSNELKARTGYLSITRGDGGQNLIGTELRELLGVLRTQELLAARRVDGGEQFFTRANDFGYSKHPNETLRIWDKEAVLGDVVRVIRNFRPDIIINRFDHRTPGSTHGHHTSSAILSVEAFDIAGSKEAYAEQLQTLSPWQPRRIFFNTSWWFYGSPENFEKANKDNMLQFDIGTYYPMKGLSNNEIAAKASSQHLSQGFGRVSERGSQPEYIELLKGDLPEDKTDLFDGINTTWTRVSGGKAIGEILDKVQANFNFKDPSTHLPELMKAYDLITELEDAHWRAIKTRQMQELIVAVSGLFIEVSAAASEATPGSTADLNIELVNRSKANMRLVSVQLANGRTDRRTIELVNNQKTEFTLQTQINPNTTYTSPYWLAKKGSLGMYKVADPDLIGKPETPRALVVSFNMEIEGKPITFDRDVIHRYSKPDKGELYEPFEILPAATASFKDKVLLFTDVTPKEVPVTVVAHKDNVEGEVELKTAEGWKVDQSIQRFSIDRKGEAVTLNFMLEPPTGEAEEYIYPIIRINGKEITHQLEVIPYSHIPKQSVLLPAEVKVVRLNLNRAGENIAYIPGAGDNVAESLRQIGYHVQVLEPEQIQQGELDKFDAVVVGIRAYNVSEDLKFRQPLLFEYVENGGTLVLQYNTAGRRDRPYEELAPYPIQLSRDRVTDENSEVIFLAGDHPVLNFPNTITKKDFDGWVQERGLYFPNEWDERFTPVLSMNDEGESPKSGSLLVAPYGKGHYIYTGLSFFRELPAGVPGAFKLFTNILSIGKQDLKKKPNIKG
ncbi:PIG-L family deacetylase [Lentiprolixibacter aurantiacus]|uniref:PIG-L family deacetylase n=1 Tax=Lentiprolixibacter aurantiacus TaxID=2993939 RepID=A0AAE3ML18_9FLAO|nr:PIG-L family deacetylase [Lentiprolixibacter aurantiacus]MCX2719785.1 PIG-L family deacetylase [Lentiprolixibacter aurantiacus]